MTTLQQKNLPTTDNLNTWWTLTQLEQEAIAKSVPVQESWSLDCTKHEKGVWIFSLPQYKTINESFCGGTEKVIDWHYEKITGKKPVTGSTVTLTVSEVEQPNSDAKAVWLDQDYSWKESNIYLDGVSGLRLWLCPYLQVLFKCVPMYLYISFSNVE